MLDVTEESNALDLTPLDIKRSVYLTGHTHSRVADLFLDEGDIYQRRVRVDELEHESLRYQVILVRCVCSMVFLRYGTSKSGTTHACMFMRWPL